MHLVNSSAMIEMHNKYLTASKKTDKIITILIFNQIGMKKILKIEIFLSVFTVLMLSSQGAFSQQMSANQKYGACAGYHQYWALLSMQSKAYGDQKFSESVVSQIDAVYGTNSEYNNMKSRALQMLVKAMQENNHNMIKSTAGFCAELNLPIGRNTK